jgi:hypothetical protein
MANATTSEKITVPYYNEMIKANSGIYEQGQKIFIGKSKYLPVGADEFIHINHDDRVDINNQAKTLHIIGKKEDIPNAVELIGKFPNIEYLTISRDLIPFDKVNLDMVKSFSIHPCCDKNIDTNGESNLWLSEQILPNVEYFSFYSDQPASDFCGITPKNLPNLKWIDCTIANKKMLKTIQNFKTVIALSAKNVGKQDVFLAFENRLKTLKLSGRFAGFPMQKISSQTSLEILVINSYKSEFDMRWLLSLNLKEIQLINCLKVINAEALLEMDNLKSLFILNCKNALSSELKLKLKDRDFEYLEIDFT